MKEIRIHGRGGQGSVVLAQLIATAALEDGKYSQAFPFLGGGGDRKGKPIQAFARLDERPIRLRCKVHNPDYVLVQDSTILDEVDVLEGLRPTGVAIINSEKSPKEIGLPTEVNAITMPAARIAMDALGRPITNTALAGIFAALTEEVSLSALLNAIKGKFPGEVGEQNAMLAQRAYEHARNRI